MIALSKTAEERLWGDAAVFRYLQMGKDAVVGTYGVRCTDESSCFPAGNENGRRGPMSHRQRPLDRQCPKAQKPCEGLDGRKTLERSVPLPRRRLDSRGARGSGKAGIFAV